MSDIEAEIVAYLDKTFGARVRGMSTTSSLLGDGRLDSVAILDMVQYLEGRYGIIIPDDQLDEANFETIVTVAAMVRRLASAGEAK